VEAGLGFERAPEDEMKERQTAKACRRGTVFQQGNEEENKEWTHGTAKLRASTCRDEGDEMDKGKAKAVIVDLNHGEKRKARKTRKTAKARATAFTGYYGNFLNRR